MSEPSGWIRLPSATSASASAATSRGSWSGGVAMSASAKTMSSPSAASIPARTAEPLPAWGTLRSRSSRAVALCASAASPTYSERARTRAAVPSVLPSSTTRTSTVARQAASGSEHRYAEQLVQRGPQTGLLVERGQDYRKAGETISREFRGAAAARTALAPGGGMPAAPPPAAGRSAAGWRRRLRPGSAAPERRL